MILTAIIRLLAIALLLQGTTAARAAGWPWPSEPIVRGEEQLQLNAQIIRRTLASNPVALAAHVSPEGHWTFVNPAGETFTASSDTEIKRALDVLLPEAGSRTPTFLLTGDCVFERREQLARLPKGAELALGWGQETFKIEAESAGTGRRLLAVVRPTLLLALTTAGDFGEALQLLRRTMERQRFRVVSLEPGGPRSLARSPRIDTVTGKPDVDPIDPAAIGPALSALRGQTAVFVGRLDSGTLTFKPASGPERTLSFDALAANAAAADVDLLVLKSASGQQPGSRNWLWQRVEIKGLEQALGHATLADFFGALGSANSRMALSIERQSPTRTSFDLRPLPGSAGDMVSASRIGGVVSDAVTNLVGNVVHTGALGNFRSSERRTEVDSRLISFVPSLAQWIFGALLVLGLTGLPTSLAWWNKLWPRENAAEYANAFGYHAAGTVRLIAYAAIFMPLSALLAAPMAVAGLLLRAARRPTKSAKSQADGR